MKTSTRWLNDYLEPPLDAEEQAELLTRAGFPLEETESIDVSDGPDVRQDFEMTSNRGDCVCHVGLAREIAAISGRALKAPSAAPKAAGPAVADAVTVENREPERCPLYSARIIRNVKIGPSPQWLQDRLIARGDIPRNNVVDATNFVLFELGQPTHVFDLDLLRGNSIIVRMAEKDEPFLPIGEGAAEIKLVRDDLVIADTERAVALAGVKGGALTAVHDGTTNLLLEAATFAPVSVRTTSRRHNIASDSSYRYERGVHPALVQPAADRLAELILDLAGGTLDEGVVSDGPPIPAAHTVEMRPARARRLLGLELEDAVMIDALERLGFQPQPRGDTIRCTVPPHRGDIEREIDLIEEVIRMHGLDRIPIAETIQIRIAPPQPDEVARRSVNDTLVGLGFVESVTHSLIGDAAAAPFLGEGEGPLRVEDERAKAEPVLKPSILPGLLRVRKHNQDNGVHDLRLFERASTFRTIGKGHDETVRYGLLMDVDDAQAGLRPMRGVVERIIRLLVPYDATIDVTPADGPDWLDPAADVAVNGARIGCLGFVAPALRKQVDLNGAVLAAELELDPLFANFPPDTEARRLPSFPAIERDLSAIVPEATAWRDLERAVVATEPAHLDALAFVTAFRGKPIAKGMKSVTLRLRFRAPDRTLTHEEIDPAVNGAIAALETLGAEIRR